MIKFNQGSYIMNLFILMLIPLFGISQVTGDTLEIVHKIPSKTLDEQPPLNCFVSDVEAFAFENHLPPLIKDHASKCVTFLLVTDYFTVQQFGGDRAAIIDWMIRVETEQKVLFGNEEINISFIGFDIPFESMWADSLGSTTAILTEFGFRFKNSPGAIKHFVTLRNLFGGVAWVNMLCKKSGPTQSWGPFAVSTAMQKTFPPFPTYSWTIMVFAHESGHVMGSQHTQACVWGPGNNMAIDDCVSQQYGPCDYIMPILRGTVMSYCHLHSNGINLALGFGPLPGDLIRNAISNASCLHGEDPVVLTGELEGEIVGKHIELSNATNITGNVYLTAMEVSIDFTSEFNPILEINTKYCDQ